MMWPVVGGWLNVAALSKVTVCALAASAADAAPAHPVLTRRIATTSPTRTLADLPGCTGDSNPYIIPNPHALDLVGRTVAVRASGGKMAAP
jgi:hypothetical protein